MCDPQLGCLNTTVICGDDDACTTDACVVCPDPPVAVVVADATTLAHYPDRNTGNDNLEVDADLAKQAFLAISVTGTAGRTVTSVTLRLTVTDDPSAASVDSGGRIHPASCDWEETTLTWNSEPPISPTVIDEVPGPITPTQLVEFDLTGAINGDGTHCFTLTTLSPDSVRYYSREREWGPEVEITVTESAPECENGLSEIGCLHTSITCDDGDPCTNDVCEPANGCGFISACEDGNACTADACDPLLCAPSVLNLVPDADTYVDAEAEATWDHGAADHVDVDADPRRLTFLKFDLSDVAREIRSATLTLYSINGSPDGGTVYSASDSSWIEGEWDGSGSDSEGGPGLKWSDIDTNEDGRIDVQDISAYIPDSTQPIAALGATTAGEPVTADVTAAFQGGPAVYTLVIRNEDTNRAGYSSREDDDPQRWPTLHLEFDPEPGCGCSTIPIVCEDENACTADSCDPATGCEHTPISCDDGNACTTDSCDPISGCSNAPVSCDDGDACTADSCDPAVGCTTGPIDCNDFDACTNDTCDPATGCVHSQISCDDGNACSADACNSQSGCTHAQTLGCIPCLTEADCDEAMECTMASCNLGVCEYILLPDCDICVPTTEACGDGFDNDGDGLTDCLDPDCEAAATCVFAAEICGDCLDNDGDGLVDYEDSDCCGQQTTLRLLRVKLRPSTAETRGNRVKLRTVYAKSLDPIFDPLMQDTSLQISDSRGSIFCKTVAAQHWSRRTRRVVAFRDKSGDFSGGLTSGSFTARRRRGVIFDVRGRSTPLRAMDPDSIRITVRVGGTCSQSTEPLRVKKTTLVHPWPVSTYRADPSPEKHHGPRRGAQSRDCCHQWFSAHPILNMNGHTLNTSGAIPLTERIYGSHVLTAHIARDR